MTLSTQMVSGLASGFDWRTMIDQIMDLEHRRVDLIENKKSEYESKLEEWRSFNTTLLSLKTAAENLKDPSDFKVYTSSMTSNSSTLNAEDLLSVSTSSSASPGSYTVKVNNLATAQKLSSASFSSYSDGLGSSYAGDIIINGTTISIGETDDLTDVRTKINNSNSGTNPTGVTASIVTYGANDYRLILTSDSTGDEGISLQNGSSSGIVELFGWKDKTESVKNSITGGAQSDTFTSTTDAIKDLLGLSSTQSGTVEVGGQNVAIDLSSDSLEDIKTNIDALSGISASIITDTDGGSTRYKLQIDGTQTFADDQNILESIGILEHGVSVVKGSTSGNTMTTNGNNINSSTVLANIDGYYTWTSGDSITISGTDHDGNAVNQAFTITSSSTVQDLLDDIESSFEANGSEVSVYVTNDGKIEVSDLESGASSLSVSLSSSITDGALDWGAFTSLDTVRQRELISGQDASVTIDGVEVTNSENKITGVVPGVTLNLVKADSDTTVTLDVDRDLTKIEEKITSFVEAYNAVASYIGEQQSYDEETGQTGGILFGDGTLSSVKFDITSVLTESVWGVSTEFSTLGLVGINLDNEGQLSINSDTLRGYLETNFNDVMNLFIGNGTSNVGTIDYVGHSRDSKAGTYAVNITQAATRNSSTGDTAVNATLGSDETLTITDGGNTATVSLTSSMTISDIVNAVNTEIDTIYTEKLVSATSVTASSSPITFATNWGDIDGGNLVNGDVISFSGTDRNGNSISGTYTISDTGSDTVQGLLTAIESAYNSQIDGSIDGSGRLVLTDENEGDSELSFSLDYSGTTNGVDIFGTVLSSNSGGQEGRYAMEITASNDGSNHLKLTSDSYGSAYSFEISETADLLWTSGDQSSQNGLDVAGTINGESATGIGQKLTGDEDEANIDGLSILYTGSTTGNVGNITLTLGSAELFERSLFNIADPYDGYVAFKQESLDDRIDSMEDQIQDMEDRLDQKMSSMINKFIAMEKAISAIQSQSQWLSSQINSISNGWG